MSTMEDHALIGRAMMEPEFRKRLLSDPEGTVKAEKLNISSDLLGQLKQLDNTMADQVGRLIGTVFGQAGVSELSDDDLEKAAGGIGMVTATPQKPITLQEAGIQRDFNQGLFIDPGRFRAPTTW